MQFGKQHYQYKDINKMIILSNTKMIKTQAMRNNERDIY